MTELKPCPFCGYSAVLENWKSRKGYEANVSCGGCLANIGTVTYDTTEQAKIAVQTAWNTRTS